MESMLLINIQVEIAFSETIFETCQTHVFVEILGHFRTGRSDWRIFEKLSVQNMAAKKPLILMLHGYTQNKDSFSDKTSNFPRKLKAVADLEYINAPFQVEGVDMEKDDPRAWWTYDSPHIEPTEDNALERFNRKTVGWEKSRKVLASAWTTQRPIILLGFSQGAVVVHRLLIEIESDLYLGTSILKDSNCSIILENPPKGVILASGFPSFALPDYPKMNELVQAGKTRLLRTPSLHINGVNDKVVPTEMQLLLRTWFVNMIFLEHEKGHSLPGASIQITTVKSFLNQVEKGFLFQAAKADIGDRDED
jgi:predicted esterase